ncbi:MAG: tetratricopeptide repeat protein [Deltaproteobacteria bacterium]|nr:tetratricopeptide repeat protein [Deltaproteobacteria bacterium]TLN03432.1 MAG: tetratricopeptide repeat protein [bacterium]
MLPFFPRDFVLPAGIFQEQLSLLSDITLNYFRRVCIICPCFRSISRSLTWPGNRIGNDARIPMKKSLLLVLAVLASLSCGFDWTFGLSGKCNQAKKIVSVLEEKKDSVEREQAERKVLELCGDGAPGHYVKALQRERESDLDGAITAYQECLKRDAAFPLASGKLGFVYYRKGLFDEAALELTKALSAKNDPLYHKGLAEVYAAKKMFPLAIYHFELAQKGLPADVSLYVGIADIYRRQGLYEESREEYLKALAVNASDVEARLGMAELNLDLNHTDEAFNDLRVLQTANPQNKRIHLLLGQAYERKGDLKTAEYEYLLAGKNRSIELMEQLRKGNEYLQSGNYVQAMSELETALKEKPGDVQTLRKLGDAYMAAGRDDEAISSYREANRLKGGTPDLHRNLGVLYEKKGLLDEAVVEYRQSLSADPENPDTLRLLADIYTLRGSNQQAIELYQELVRMKKDTPKTHFMLAKAYFNNRDYKEARNEYALVVRQDPDNQEAHRELADLYRKSSLDAEAERHYKEALRLKKDDMESRNALLALYVKKKKFPEVVALLRENVELAPSDPVAHYKLGLIHEFNKNYDEAVLAYQKSIDLKGDNAKALNALGRVYMKSGRMEEAKIVLEQAKKADPKLEETKVLLGNIRDEIAPEPQVFRKKAYSSGKKSKKSKRDRSARKGKKSKKSSESLTKKGKKSKKSSKSLRKNKKSSSGEKSKKSTSSKKKAKKTAKGKKKR